MDDEEEDVVIKGSDLHQALASMGYTDCELELVNKKNVLPTETITRKYRRIEILRNFFDNWHPLDSIFYYAPKIHVSSKQFQAIMRAESLLDDHAAIVGSFLEKNSTFWNKFMDWSSHMISSAMVAIAYSMFKRKKTFAVSIPLSIAAFIAICKYKEFQAVRSLKDLVTVQNELYRLYKKSLGVLRNVYRIRVDGKKSSAKFSKLEADRLEYLQPFTETLLKSMEKVSLTYYRASSMIVDQLPKSLLENYSLTRFEADEFAIKGEITYEKVRHLYYVYILVQSDTMQLLAIAYDTWREHARVSQSRLTRIIEKLCRSLKNEQNRMTSVTGEFETRKRKTIERKFRLTSATKWRDLYLNLELMSRRLQTVYDETNAILETIEKHENIETNEELFIAELATRTRDVYSQIDKSRNFAEFNNLLIAALQRSGKVANDSISKIDSAPVEEAEGDRSFVRDREPEIIDEVFEEYITEEYLRPLYEESDEATIDIAKFDELLAKNFMCELKEALVEKYKSMSEREAKALLRKYRDTGKCENSEDDRVQRLDSNNDAGKSIIPRPPPLPNFVETAKDSSAIPPPSRKAAHRRPVPLPRAKNDNLISHQHAMGQSRVFVPPPPPPLPPILPFTDAECNENAERFSIGLPNLADRKIPAFVTFTEEFVGSGENSEEEPEECDKDNDE